MKGVDSAVLDARPADPAEEAEALAQVEAALFGRPVRVAKVGRYELLRGLGSGAFGAVYEARDPELERRVAIKLVRPASDSFGDPDARMVREAKLLAQLSHPNVVAVHDFGIADLDPDPRRAAGPQIYIVMELVEGPTLLEWLTQRPRSRDEVLDAFTEAARGLAAAHAKGIVHRDFKPSNVLIGTDGRVRVSDFGLARLFGDDSTGVGNASTDFDGASGSLDVSVTATGTVLGTPIYMAPEQHAGDTGDARSDQYAFCIALWEALIGVRPFEGNIVQIARAKATFTDGPAPPNIPRRLWRVLVRGLQPVASRRYSDVSALIEALERARRRPVRMAVAAVSVAATLAVGWALAGSDEDCAPRDELAEGLWSAADREATRAAFAASTASPSGPVVMDALEAWLGRWSAAKLQVCAAERSRGDDPDAPRRDACLDRQAARWHAFVGRLDGNQPAALEVAAQRLAAMPPLEPCLGEIVPNVAEHDGDPGPALSEIEAAQTWIVAGAPSEALEQLAELERSLPNAAHGIRAEAMLVRHHAQRELGNFERAAQTLDAALPLAERAGDDLLAAEIAVERVAVVGVQQDRTDAGRALVGPARARLEGAGASEALEPRLLLTEGRIDLAAGDYGAAVARFEEVRRRLHNAAGEQRSMLSAVENNLGVAYERQGEFSRAREQYETGLALRESLVGKNDPKLINGLINLAWMEIRTGDLEAGARHIRRVLDLLDRHPEKAGAHRPRALHILAGTFMREGQCDQALAAEREALQILRTTWGARHRRVAVGLLQIARVLIDCKSPEAALPLLAEARDTLVQVDAPPSLVAKVHVNEGWALSKLKRFDEAIAAHTEARDLAVREHGGDHPDVAYATGQIGSDHLNADRPDTALPFLEDALAMYDRLGTKGDDRGFVELMAARVLAARDPVRARSLATRALGRFADMPGRDEQRAALTALLEELPR